MSLALTIFPTSTISLSTLSLAFTRWLILFISLLSLHACSTFDHHDVRVVGINSKTDMLTYRYIQQISNKIEIIGATRYPDLNADIPVATQIDIELVITNPGRLASARLLKSSLQPQLDKKMMDIIRYSAPYPPLPDDLKLDTLIIQKRWQFNPSN